MPASDNTVCTLASYTKGNRSLLLSGSLRTIRVSNLVIGLSTYIFFIPFSSQVWDAERMTTVTELKGHNHWVRAMVVSEHRLYSGSYNMIKVFFFFFSSKSSLYFILFSCSKPVLFCFVFVNFNRRFGLLIRMNAFEQSRARVEVFTPSLLTYMDKTSSAVFTKIALMFVSFSSEKQLLIQTH